MALDKTSGPHYTAMGAIKVAILSTDVSSLMQGLILDQFVTLERSDLSRDSHLLSCIQSDNGEFIVSSGVQNVLGKL
jgi:hypothetical protein